MIILLIIIVLLAALLVFIQFTPKPDPAAWAPFQRRYIAHRGLHSPDRSVPENSLAAFVAAAEAGYGIELDLQLSSDGRVMVFHDDSLQRVCGVDALIEKTHSDDLAAARLCDTNQTIPFFEDVLSLVAGRVPLVVELKHSTRGNELCQKAYEMLKNYNGEYCVESFDPFIVAWFRKNAPEIVRGQLITSFASYRKTRDFWSSFALSNNLLGFMTRPNFIARELGKKPFTVKLAESFGAKRVCWTSRVQGEGKNDDCVIFEHYLPPVRY